MGKHLRESKTTKLQRNQRKSRPYSKKKSDILKARTMQRRSVKRQVQKRRKQSVSGSIAPRSAFRSVSKQGRRSRSRKAKPTQSDYSRSRNLRSPRRRIQRSSQKKSRSIKRKSTRRLNRKRAKRTSRKSSRKQPRRQHKTISRSASRKPRTRTRNPRKSSMRPSKRRLSKLSTSSRSSSRSRRRSSQPRRSLKKSTRSRASSRNQSRSSKHACRSVSKRQRIQSPKFEKVRRSRRRTQRSSRKNLYLSSKASKTPSRKPRRSVPKKFSGRARRPLKIKSRKKTTLQKRRRSRSSSRKSSCITGRCGRSSARRRTMKCKNGCSLKPKNRTRSPKSTCRIRKTGKRKQSVKKSREDFDEIGDDLSCAYSAESRVDSSLGAMFGELHDRSVGLNLNETDSNDCQDDHQDDEEQSELNLEFCKGCQYKFGEHKMESDIRNVNPKTETALYADQNTRSTESKSPKYSQSERLEEPSGSQSRTSRVQGLDGPNGPACIGARYPDQTASIENSQDPLISSTNTTSRRPAGEKQGPGRLLESRNQNSSRNLRADNRSDRPQGSSDRKQRSDRSRRTRRHDNPRNLEIDLLNPTSDTGDSHDLLDPGYNGGGCDISSGPSRTSEQDTFSRKPKVEKCLVSSATTDSRQNKIPSKRQADEYKNCKSCKKESPENRNTDIRPDDKRNGFY